MLVELLNLHQSSESVNVFFAIGAVHVNSLLSTQAGAMAVRIVVRIKRVGMGLWW